jgi:hypothetical protein
LVTVFFDDEYIVNPYVVEPRSKTKSPIKGHILENEMECYNQLVKLKGGSYPNEGSILLLVTQQQAAVSIFLF